MNKARSVRCTPAGRTATADASTAAPMVVSMATEPSRRLDATDMAPLLHNSAPPVEPSQQTAPVEPKFGEPKFGEPKFGEPKFGEPKFGEPKFGKPKFGKPKFGPKGLR